jgi:hypothetical protein
MSELTLVHEDDALHLYWHEAHGYYLADWQPVFRKGEALKRSYQACIDAARTRRGAPWLADVSKVPVLDKQGAAKGIWKSGIEVSVHQTRAQAEAAILEWLEKQRNE